MIKLSSSSSSFSSIVTKPIITGRRRRSGGGDGDGAFFVNINSYARESWRKNNNQHCSTATFPLLGISAVVVTVMAMTAMVQVQLVPFDDFFSNNSNSNNHYYASAFTPSALITTVPTVRRHHYNQEHKHRMGNNNLNYHHRNFVSNNANEQLYHQNQNRQNYLHNAISTSIHSVAGDNKNSDKGNDDDNNSCCWSLQQLEEYTNSDSVGVVLEFTTSALTGGYRCIARAKHNESIILGYVEGFLRPPPQLDIVHMDKMEIYQYRIERVKREKPNTLNFNGINIGLGRLMGYRCLLYAKEQGSSRTKVEFLAINDEEYQHRRLIKYYRYAGFDIVKYVGEDISSIPDRLIWGGRGTLMKQNINILMIKWTKLFQLMQRKSNKILNSSTGEE
jgi:hypothetical protein